MDEKSVIINITNNNIVVTASVSLLNSLSIWLLHACYSQLEVKPNFYLFVSANSHSAVELYPEGMHLHAFAPF